MASTTWDQVGTAYLVASERGNTDETGYFYLNRDEAVEAAKKSADTHRFPFRVYRVQLMGVATHREAEFDSILPKDRARAETL